MEVLATPARVIRTELQSLPGTGLPGEGGDHLYRLVYSAVLACQLWRVQTVQTRKAPPPTEHSCSAWSWPDCFFKQHPNQFLLTGQDLSARSSNHACPHLLWTELWSLPRMKCLGLGRLSPGFIRWLSLSSLWALDSPRQQGQRQFPTTTQTFCRVMSRLLL